MGAGRYVTVALQMNAPVTIRYPREKHMTDMKAAEKKFVMGSRLIYEGKRNRNFECRPYV